MIDKLLEEYLHRHFSKERIRGLIVYKDGNIQFIPWDELNSAIKAPEEFVEDVYELIGRYDPERECVCFIANGTTQYLIQVKKLNGQI